MNGEGKKKITPAFLMLVAVALTVLLWPVSRWIGTVFSPVLGRLLLLVLTVLGISTMVSYMLPVGRLRSILHALGEFFYPLFLTALPLLLAADVVYYFRIPAAPETAMLVLCLLFVPLAAAGLIEGIRLRVKRYTAVLRSGEPLRVVLVSDLHLGCFTPAGMSETLADAVLAEKPDLVIIAGDLFDDRFESLSEKRRGRIRAGFLRLSEAVPVYACEGNHDLLCPDPRKDAFIRDCGIQMLLDESIEIHGVRFVFRRDAVNKRRAAPQTLFPRDGVPTVAVDHNPFSCSEAWENGASLVLSGHTHAGQTFPGTLLYKTRLVRGYGCFTEGEKQLIVTSGAGIYGCPIRLGAAREIVTVDMGRRV